MTPTSPEEDSPSSYHPLSELLSEGQVRAVALCLALCYKNHGVWQDHPRLASREKGAGGQGCLAPAGVSAQHRLQRTAASPLADMRRAPAK